MEVEVALKMPIQLSPLSTYETKYVYTGFGKYDTERKKLIVMKKKDGKIFITETDYTPHVISRGYYTELVRVTVYSENPKIWKEELSPSEVYFFKQVKQPVTT